MRKSDTRIAVNSGELVGHLFEPDTGLPGILFVHGWAGSQERDEARSKELAALGCVCLTFDMRGHGRSKGRLQSVTRAENLQDVLAAYDALCSHPSVDCSAIAVIGSSYGAYLTSFLIAERNVRWLAMRVPALYHDDEWDQPKHGLDREKLARLRRELISHGENTALRNCRQFAGDVLLVESEHDHLVPHPAIASYLTSFINARSITHRVITGADHALTRAEDRRSYDELLFGWVQEMVFGAR